MIRRRLFAYTLMMTAGIASGYFITERSVITGVLPFIAASAFSLMMADERKEKVILMIFLTSGLVLFSFSYLSYEEESARLSDLSGTIHIAEGRVRSVTSNDESISLTAVNPEFITEDGITIEAEHDILIRYEGDDHKPSELAGKYIRVYGNIKEAQGADNPGCFSYRSYLRSQGIGSIFTAESIEIADDDSFVMRIYSSWKGHVEVTKEGFTDSFDEETGGLLKGILFGDKGSIDKDIMEDFDINSSGHILAVSGLHVGFLYALLRILSGKRKNLPASGAVIIIIFIYGEMTTASASAMRAIIVLTVSLIGPHVRRHHDLLTSASLAALIILINEPHQLLSGGFQLSFLALAGIAFAASRLRPYMGESLSVIIAVQAGTLPASIYSFHRFNALASLINIPIIAIASILVPAAIIMLAVKAVTGMLPRAGIYILTSLTGLLRKTNSMLAGSGKLSSLMVRADMGFVVMIYLLIFGVCSEWFQIMLLRRRYIDIVKGCLLILMISSCVYIASFNVFSDDEIVFVSVGQGDCTHIRSGDMDILIDGGGSTYRNVGEDVLMPYLLSNGADNVDLALVTHLHTDHYLGIKELSDVYPVGCVGIPQDYRRSAEASELMDNMVFIRHGSRIAVSDDVYIDPIWPPDGHSGDLEIDDPNENNMVYMINYDGLKVMVTGDLLEADEHDMIEYYHGTDVLDCDILKVAHHGSSSSTSGEFLDAASPYIAVIEAGRNNIYGHPHEQTLERLRERNIRIYRTDINGAVGIDIKKNGIRIDLVNE